MMSHHSGSLYPSEIEIFGYSSRNQKDKDAYINIKRTRIKAKHNKLSNDFLREYDVTMGDVNKGLKLPINAYTGALRAPFNPLYDNLQGFSICTTGQLLILQLIHDLQSVPTLEMCEANTDAVKFFIDEEYKQNAIKILDNWQRLTGLELEEDNVVKCVARDVNNFAEIIQTGDNDYKVNYKGGELTRGEHNFKWNKDKKVFEYTYKKSLKSNSLSIVSEALLKKLLFDIPIEDTINNCNDIFRFQMISHLGSTYEKCVQESPNGDIELQKNNRIYAGLVPSGNIIKIKPNGRRDSLANCPPNPIVDNANKLTIDDIDKTWYIEYAELKFNDFMGIKRLEDYKKDELLELANKYNIDIPKNMKKKEIIEILKEKGDLINMAKKENNITETKIVETNNDKVKLLHKIDKLRRLIQEKQFVLDKAMTSNLGGEEYHSIGQYYNAVQELCIECGLDFDFQPIEELRFEKNILTPSVGAPKHLSTVRCRATLTDIDTGYEKHYMMIASGSDTMDKSVSSACTLAFRNWFKFNFSPKNRFDWDDNQNAVETAASAEPKVPAYIPKDTKKDVIEKVVNDVQYDEKTNEEFKKYIIEGIWALRDKLGDDYGKATMIDVVENEHTTSELLALKIKIQIKLQENGIELKEKGVE
jgi:hypothetical protein